MKYIYFLTFLTFSLHSNASVFYCQNNSMNLELSENQNNLKVKGSSIDGVVSNMHITRAFDTNAVGNSPKLNSTFKLVIKDAENKKNNGKLVISSPNGIKEISDLNCTEKEE
jgi:hypothetical protein